MRIFNKIPFLLVLAMGLTACGGSDNGDGGNDGGMQTTPTPSPSPTPTPEPEMAMYELTLLNTTHNQPLSPPAVILHEQGYHGWMIGSPASPALETLAESGSPADFINVAGALDTDAGSEVLMPGQSVSFTLTAPVSSNAMLTIASMLVNTNDAFTGVTAWPVSMLGMDHSIKHWAPAYDAGTESNTEAAATVPGPAGGGEGFNSSRDDVDYVARHPGVVTADDGLLTSTLDQSHRFDNGVMRITVTRK